MKPFEFIVLALLGLLVWQQYSVHNGLQQPIPQKPDTEIGRYQLLQLGAMRRDHFMVDTKTGRAWTIVCDKVLSTNKENHSIAPEDCASEGFEAINYGGDYAYLFGPGPELEEQAYRLRAEKISLMTPEEHKAFLKEEEHDRIRAEKLSLMTSEEKAEFLKEEEKQRQQAH